MGSVLTADNVEQCQNIYFACSQAKKGWKFRLVFNGQAVIEEEISSRHVTDTFQQVHFVQWFFATGYLMWTQEVVVSHPERDTVNGTIVCTIPTKCTVSLFECTIKPFDDLLEGSVFLGNCIVIGQTDDLCDEDILVLLQFKLLCSKRIGTVAVSNEFQCFTGEVFKVVKSHTHGKDTWTYIS